MINSLRKNPSVKEKEAEMHELKITLIQTAPVWENREQSCAHIDKHLNAIDTHTDIVVLPEMFTTGFSMKPEKVAEEYDSEKMKTLNWMRSWAQKLDSVIIGSVSVRDNGLYYNRLFWVRPDGSFSKYDKRHTFSFAGEHEHYKNGDSLLIEEWRGWKVCPLICYDLRFPVWSRNRLVDGKPLFDLMIYVAAWPEVRREPWKILSRARAIENQSYVVALNQVGKDGNGHIYSGDSAVMDAKGEYICLLTSHVEEVATTTLHKAELEEFRKKFPVLFDADSFDLR